MLHSWQALLALLATEVSYLSKFTEIAGILPLFLTFHSLILVVKRQHRSFAMRLAFIARIHSIYNDVELAEKGAQPGLDRLLQVTCQNFVVQCQQTGTKRDRSGGEISSTECLSNHEDVALLMHQLSDG